MQRRNAALSVRSFLQSLGLSHRCRRFCSNSDGEILVKDNGSSRTVILNRPSALNALNISMGVTCICAFRGKNTMDGYVHKLYHYFARLQKLYKCWEDDPNVGFVTIKGCGKAFSAGGDIVSLYKFIKEGNLESCKIFCRTAYTFIYHLGTYLKPHVAILNGITMGGGAGISIPGTFRIASANTSFATPETIIGFHPDAGASFYLSHLPGFLGEYLALTGAVLNGPEIVASGLATHYSKNKRISLVKKHLRGLVTDDPSDIETLLEKYGDIIYPDSTSVLHRTAALDKCFMHDTVEEIISSVEEEAGRTQDLWCTSTLKRLKEACPLSLKVSLRSIRESRSQTLDQCLKREYRLSLKGLCGPFSGNFIEGVRARVIDKDFIPKWDPPLVEQVSEDMVDDYFSELDPNEPELDLPLKIREAF